MDPRLIDATGAAIARWGLAETSLNRIAAEADMGRATFYRRGVTRDELVAALTERAAETFRAALWPAMIGTGTAAERLRVPPPTRTPILPAAGISPGAQHRALRADRQVRRASGPLEFGSPRSSA